MKSNNSLSRISEVLKRTGLSRSNLYLQVSRGSFPKSIKISEKAVAWTDQSVDDWIQSRINASQALEE